MIKGKAFREFGHHMATEWTATIHCIAMGKLEVLWESGISTVDLKRAMLLGLLH